MKIGIIGTGYVGLPSGVGFAELGNKVVCIDKDADKINALKAGRLTIFEDGLAELFQKNIQRRLIMRYNCVILDKIEKVGYR